MSEAFGVQREITAVEIPKGTSIIMQEFSPAQPQPTPINQVRQVATMDPRPTLDTALDPNEAGQQRKPLSESEDGREESQDEGRLSRLIKEMYQRAQKTAARLAEVLKNEIDNGSIEVEADAGRIVIRVHEVDSFKPGSATLSPKFIPILEKMRTIIAETPGRVSIEGHSDNIPIETNLFESNWSLSAARAASVSHALLEAEIIDSANLEIMGHADNRPIMPNDTEMGRRKNRRVEIILTEGPPEELQAELDNLQEENKQLFDLLD
jgi:chemotaxis protein MotB